MKSYNKKISCLLGLVGFALALALDQVTKYLAVMDLRENGPVILIKNVFQLQYLETGEQLSGSCRTGSSFVVIAAVILGIIGYLYSRMPYTSHYRMPRICAVLIASAVEI